MGRRILTCAFVVGTTIVASGVLAGSVTAARGAAEMAPVSTELAKLISGKSVAGHGTVIRGSVVVGGRWGADYRWYLAQKRLALHRSAPAARRVASAGGASLAPSIGVNFAGLNRNTAINHGFISTPPDTIVGASSTKVLEATNSALRLSTTLGAAIQTMDLNSFFGAGLPLSNGQNLGFDPKIYYDRNAVNRRFYVVGLTNTGKGDASTTNDTSRLFLAVSRSAEPANLAATSWCRYVIDARRNVGTSLSSWADYPGIGAGADSILITTNQFTFPSNSFTFAIVRVFRKSVISNNAPPAACPSGSHFLFQPAGAVNGNFGVFTLQPVQHYTSPSSFSGTTNPAYLLSTTRGTSNQYHVWRVRNVATSPTLSSVNVTSNITYSIPGSSPQPGTTVRLDTGDDRMLQAAGIGNSLYGSTTTGCNVGGGTVESCALTPRFTVGQSAAGAVTATLNENIAAGFANVFTYDPSMAVNASGQSASVWQVSGSGTFLSARALLRNPNTFWSSNFLISSGTCSDTGGGLGRTGDYSGVQTEPAALSQFWLAGERLGTVSGLSGCNWATNAARLAP